MKDVPKEMYEYEFISYIAKMIPYNDLLEMSNVMNINIPGFPSKKLKSVPEKMLRSHFRKRLQRLGSATNFFKINIEPNEKSYTGLNEREFLYKLKNDDEIDGLAKFILITYHFPNLYLLNKEKIFGLEDFADLMEIFIGKIDYKEDWKAKIKLLSNDIANNISQMFPGLDKKVLDELQKGLFSPSFLEILKYLDQNKYNPIHTNQVNELKEEIFVIFIYELLERWRKEKSKFENDLLSMETIKKDIEADNQSTQNKIEKLKREKEILSRNLKTLQEENKKLSKEKNDVLKTVRKEKQQLEKDYSNKIFVLKNQLQEYKKQSQQSNEKNHSHNLIDENIMLFQSEKSELTDMLLGKERVFQYHTISELEEKIVSQVNAGQLIFIATDDLSSKDIFHIEKMLKEKPDIHFRFVSQGSKSIIRTIISYLEGELRYATII